MPISIGTDIEQNSRFKNKTLEIDTKFLYKIFTDKELNYCFSCKFPSQHLCARFCAKEATIKALYKCGIKDVYYNDIEIFKSEEIPYVKILKYPNINVDISISHCENYSTATAIIQY